MPRLTSAVLKLPKIHVNAIDKRMQRCQCDNSAIADKDKQSLVYTIHAAAHK